MGRPDWKSTGNRPQSTKNVVITKTFAPKFRSEPSDREVPSSYRDYFLDNFCDCNSEPLSGNFQSTSRHFLTTFEQLSARAANRLEGLEEVERGLQTGGGLLIIIIIIIMGDGLPTTTGGGNYSHVKEEEEGDEGKERTEGKECKERSNRGVEGGATKQTTATP